MYDYKNEKFSFIIILIKRKYNLEIKKWNSWFNEWI